MRIGVNIGPTGDWPAMLAALAERGECARNRFLPEILGIEVVASKSIDQMSKGWVEESDDKKPCGLGVAVEASDECSPGLRLSRVALIRLQERAKRDGIDELVENRLPLACADEPVAEGDRIEVALEFL